MSRNFESIYVCLRPLLYNDLPPPPPPPPTVLGRAGGGGAVRDKETAATAGALPATAVAR